MGRMSRIFYLKTTICMGIALFLAGCVKPLYTNHIRGSQQEQIATWEKDSDPVHSPSLRQKDEIIRKCKKESCKEKYYKKGFCSKHFKESIVGICCIADCKYSKYQDGKCYIHWNEHLFTTKSNKKDYTQYKKPKKDGRKANKRICWRTGCANYEYVGTKEFHDKNGLGACRKHFYEMENWSDERYLIEKVKQDPNYLPELNKRIDEVMGK